jgi:hypothetical protein
MGEEDNVEVGEVGAVLETLRLQEQQGHVSAPMYVPLQLTPEQWVLQVDAAYEAEVAAEEALYLRNLSPRSGSNSAAANTGPGCGAGGASRNATKHVSHVGYWCSGTDAGGAGAVSGAGTGTGTGAVVKKKKRPFSHAGTSSAFACGDGMEDISGEETLDLVEEDQNGSIWYTTQLMLFCIILPDFLLCFAYAATFAYITTAKLLFSVKSNVCNFLFFVSLCRGVGLWGVWETCSGAAQGSHFELQKGGVFRAAPVNRPAAVNVSLV